MKSFKKALHLVSTMMMLFFLNLFNANDRARGDDHFMEAMVLVKFEEKIEAQDFALKDLNGNVVHLNDYRGKIVFLNFWATWCPPCRAEMPSMEKLYVEFKDKDFIILAVDLQEDIEKVREFKEAYRLNFPILLDSDGVVGSHYAVFSLPTTYLIDREGYFIAAALGARDWASKEALGLIVHLLNNSAQADRRK